LNEAQIEQYLVDWCAAFGCTILEIADGSLTVKLSNEADQRLTNRPYYWMFVERTETPPEPMTMQWLVRRGADAKKIPQLHCSFGSNGLQQLFRAARERGSFVRLFEQPDEQAAISRGSRAYVTWAEFHLVIEYVCDRKREQLLTPAVCLQTGQWLASLADVVEGKTFDTNLPWKTHMMREYFSLEDAWQRVKEHVQAAIQKEDSTWAEQANVRYEEELALHEAYVGSCTQPITDAQTEARREEIAWQYQPRIHVRLRAGALYHMAQNHEKIRTRRPGF
jgi:hypothetical protein